MSKKGLSIKETGKLATEIQLEIGKVVLGKQQTIEALWGASGEVGGPLDADQPAMPGFFNGLHDPVFGVNRR